MLLQVPVRISEPFASKWGQITLTRTSTAPFCPPTASVRSKAGWSTTQRSLQRERRRSRANVTKFQLREVHKFGANSILSTNNVVELLSDFRTKHRRTKWTNQRVAIAFSPDWYFNALGGALRWANCSGSLWPYNIKFAFPIRPPRHAHLLSLTGLLLLSPLAAAFRRSGLFTISFFILLLFQFLKLSCRQD